MAKTKPPAKEQIEAYLAGIEPIKRKALEHIRALIKRAAPEAEEAMIYGVPGFRKDGPLVCYAAFTAHCGFYPISPAVMAAMTDALAGFETAESTIRFIPDKPIPDALILDILNRRIAENAAKVAAKAKRTKA